VQQHSSSPETGASRDGPNARTLRALVEEARRTRCTPVGVLRLIDSDRVPVLRVTARWSCGTATVMRCPRCKRPHSHRMPSRGAPFVLLPCTAHFKAPAVRMGYVVDARPRAAVGARRSSPGGKRSA